MNISEGAKRAAEEIIRGDIVGACGHEAESGIEEAQEIIQSTIDTEIERLKVNDPHSAASLRCENEGLYEERKENEAEIEKLHAENETLKLKNQSLIDDLKAIRAYADEVGSDDFFLRCSDAIKKAGELC